MKLTPIETEPCEFFAYRNGKERLLKGKVTEYLVEYAEYSFHTHGCGTNTAERLSVARRNARYHLQNVRDRKKRYGRKAA